MNFIVFAGMTFGVEFQEDIATISYAGNVNNLDNQGAVDSRWLRPVSELTTESFRGVSVRSSCSPL
jgi:hypothetical protein